MRRICFVCHALLWLAWTQCHLLSQPELDTHMHLQQQLISQSNDSLYVQRIMRLAKTAEMRSLMQTELDPCDDFYGYSCGNWPKINPANAAQPRETNYQQLLSRGYQHKQQRLLEQPADDDDDEAVLKAKQFYASCLHYRETSRANYRQQLQQIAAEFGQMPALLPHGAAWNASEFDLLSTLAKIKRSYGLDILLSVQKANETQSRLYVGQPRKLLQTASKERLEQHLGLTAEAANQLAQQLMQFEQQLGRGTTSAALQSLALPHAAAELATKYAPALNLTRYVELVLQRPLQAEELLYEQVPGYHAHLSQLLTNTTTELLANYVYQQLLQRFYYEQESSSMAAQCLASVQQLFPELLEHMTYSQYADAATLSDINELWQQLKDSFQQIIEQTAEHAADWPTNQTRLLMLQHLNATRLEINAYAHINFTARYAQLELQPRDYLFNMRAVLAHSNKLATHVVAPLLPSYDVVEQRVLLPVALLQPNFLWSRYYPRALRYASLGSILSQQLAHSFDQRNNWDAASLAGYKQHIKCFKHQYERLRFAGDYLPASELQHENMADNLGIQLALLAYNTFLQRLASTALSSEQLPQLSYSPQQLFFIGYAQLWCNDANEQFRDKHSLLSAGTPNALRVQGALANLNAFASAFKCAAGSRFNPSHKCHVYGPSVSA
ncbi:neprilysin-1 [Drosophila busckii]|uniref:neprilysin-1 n=1 Tax=Drosophila busckii TaxID=30019 RepID=UPI00083F2FE7|nr:neprilysin-1 [Drosophila busckii]